MQNKNIKYGEHRTIQPETTKAIFNCLPDFEKYWTNKNEQYLKKYSSVHTKEEMINVNTSTIQKISSEFRDGDEIIHFDDFGYAPERCEREFVLIRRNGKVVKSILIRMS
jgi:hypothetical protein